jgi:pimeloyl-ACP methyl ester carboxylesterase
LRPARSSDDVINHYVRMFSTRDSRAAASGGTGRSTRPSQNAQRKSRRLTMLVLAIGGDASFGQHVGDAVTAVADDVQSVVIPGTGRLVAEEAPDEMLAALTAFLAPYRDGSPAADGPRPHTAAAPRR